jgi:hypothetical protein
VTPDSGYLTSSIARRDLVWLNALFIENFIRNDVASHDAILHPDFLYVTSGGGRVDRATYLKNWATGFDPHVIPYWDTRDELITIIGNLALVRAVNKHVIRRNGHSVTGMSAYTDTYLYDGGAWKCVQAQITPVAPEQEPGDDTIISVYINGVNQTRAANVAEPSYPRAGGLRPARRGSGGRDRPDAG